MEIITITKQEKVVALPGCEVGRTVWFHGFNMNNMAISQTQAAEIANWELR